MGKAIHKRTNLTAHYGRGELVLIDQTECGQWVPRKHTVNQVDRVTCKRCVNKSHGR